MERTHWYKDGVFYQIWPRSFKDGNGDGLGDLYGVLEKLDYIKSLGCDGIWFSPLYVSPGVDCGYDIEDYYHIAPEFGGDEAFDKVLKAAKEKGLRIIMDLVVNHTSTDCIWFQKSRRREEPYTDFYIWRDAKPNGKMPNNWDSEFEGGSAWQWDEIRQQYYLHIFAIKQADLNHDNPLVREEVKKILKYWLDKGVDGFREDVITYISKPAGLPNEHIFPIHKGLTQYNMGPHLHEYLSEYKHEVLDNYDYVSIAEATLIKPKKALSLIEEGPQNVIDMVIQFECQCADCFLTDYLPLPFSLRKMKRSFRNWQEKLAGKAWNLLYIENHDHPRMVSRYGSEDFREESAKALCAVYMFLQGTPFVYQGQEIGMSNWNPNDPDMYEDVQSRNYALNKSPEKRLKILRRSSRDSARTPVQWDDSENAGFTTGKPWFFVNDNYKEVNVASQDEDLNSILNFYRKTIELRKSLSVVKDGTYKEYRKASNSFYIYTREDENDKILIVCSFKKTKTNLTLPAGLSLNGSTLLLGNYRNGISANNGSAFLEDFEDLEICKGSGNKLELNPYEVRVYRLSE